MEGLIPLVYRALVQYRGGAAAQAALAGSSWFSESPSAHYVRLPGDSGRFSQPEIQLFRQDRVFSGASSSSSSSMAPSTGGASQSPMRRSASRRHML
ncbi:hypothetical protein AMTRI_Chr03g147250 [Amborella trichopoda]|uniref:Uncharacterized protein n=1 Tax=Amborella trichopoda TaxID=13333 RepID=W1P1A8_AMBTC|nr:hypothetical protein AMTR_s00002p00258240 [Amborella trichopoda]